MASATLLCMLLFLPAAQLHSQDEATVNIRALNRPLVAVLDDLTRQCGYNFTFDSRLIDSRRRITMNLKDITIAEAIDTLFAEPGLTYRVIRRNIVVYPEGDPEKQVPAEPGETMLTVRGVVNDKSTGKPLSYATLSLYGTTIGTITNDEGRFTLQVPDTLEKPVIVSSFIGYRDRYIPVSGRSDRTMEIVMDRNMISLQEVIIRYQDPASLLADAIERMPENYMDVSAGLQIYYRENVTKNDRSMIFSEAVAEIAKAPYKNAFFAEKSRILKGRKITNIELQDTVVLKIRSGLNSMLQLDIANHTPAFLSDDFNAIFNLNFSDVVWFRDQLVYVISFKPKEHLEEIFFEGDLYIDRQSLAILAADFRYDPERLSREEDMFVARRSRGIRIRPIAAEYHVEYRPSDQGFYLSMVQGEVRFKIRRKRQWIASRYQINLEMAVTGVDPGNPPKISLGEQLKYHSVLSDHQFEYDPEFWGSYNTIRPEVSLTEALKLIEHAMQEITGNE